MTMRQHSQKQINLRGKYIMEETNSKVPKAKYWNVVMYPESMIDDWQNKVGSLLEFPYAYCIHDKDCDENGEIRKTHVHFILAYSNTTTKNCIIELFSRLGVINTCQVTRNIRNSYDYLIHDTADAKADGKYLYDKSERILGNNFDIGNYEQLSLEDKQKIEDDLFDEIVEQDFQDFYECSIYVRQKYRNDTQVRAVFKSNQNYFKNVVMGNYLHKQRIRQGEIDK